MWRWWNVGSLGLTLGCAASTGSGLADVVPADSGPADIASADGSRNDTGTASRIERVVAGLQHTCAWRGDGTVHCWGYNFGGVLGDGTSSPRAGRVMVVGFAGVADLTAGYVHTCALRARGGVACWGQN